MKAIWTLPVSKPSQTAFPREDPNHGALELKSSVFTTSPTFLGIYINTPKLYAGR